MTATIDQIDPPLAAAGTRPRAAWRTRLVRAWNGFWFAPSSAGNLGFCRVLLFGLALLVHLGIDYPTFGLLPQSFMQPIWIFKKLGLQLGDVATLATLATLWRVALVFAAVGLFTRISMWVSIVLSVYLMGVPYALGKTSHSDGALLLAMVIFGLSRCGDAWSLDVLRRDAIRFPHVTTTPLSGDYTWPIRCVWLLQAMVFFGAGVAKLRVSGLSWITSDNLRILLLQHYYLQDPLLGLGRTLWDYPLICKFFAAGTIVMEVLFPLALLNRHARKVLVAGMFLLQTGIYLVMDVLFLKFAVIYTLWIPWDRVGRRVATWFAGIRRRAVLYDGGCGFCTRTVGVLYHLDLLDKTIVYDIVHQWPLIHERFPALDRDACLRDMHVVRDDGQVTRGYDAYRSLAWALPICWIVLPLLYLPPVAFVGRRVYRCVADHRHDAGCEIPLNAPRGE